MNNCIFFNIIKGQLNVFFWQFLFLIFIDLTQSRLKSPMHHVLTEWSQIEESTWKLLPMKSQLKNLMQSLKTSIVILGYNES